VNNVMRKERLTLCPHHPYSITHFGVCGKVTVPVELVV